MYFRFLDSVSDRARVPHRFSLIFRYLEENSSSARRSLAFLGTVLLALITRLRSIPPVAPARTISAILPK
jgi:hypothetical protein